MSDGGRDDERRGGLSRRGFLASVGIGVGVSAVGLLGQSVEPLAPSALLAPRQSGRGPQGLPVNTTARAARVESAASSELWRLRVSGAVGAGLALTLPQLRELEQVEVELPIACVEGWSGSAHWKGVRLAEVVELAGGKLDGGVTMRSIQENSRYASSEVDVPHLRDEMTLIALEINGEPLSLDHGYPARLISPNRPGVMQTKWLREVVVR